MSKHEHRINRYTTGDLARKCPERRCSAIYFGPLSEISLGEWFVPESTYAGMEEALRAVETALALADDTCADFTERGRCDECIGCLVKHARELTAAALPPDATAEEVDNQQAAECDLCEEPVEEPGDGVLHRWHVRDGSTLELCEDCLGKCFAWAWDHIPLGASATAEEVGG